ncbi:hypothetical protein A2311_06665 [candidate division WOR-1 bacterium RIFOXYB2_FULL_48_7]|uniref:FAD:protein FMN transferase n=1 Tax=candidate division WOR-1 bacterium RIFOXYB2_FULL_48_7 TaxID=1802583 RepID=A0A1F4TAA1_UNCSA|nr:MAG: hypothetical protein A2311_06665 [candidate division WOR-1 bacterium RIFOXYB2_FULL_48_7]
MALAGLAFFAWPKYQENSFPVMGTTLRLKAQGGDLKAVYQTFLRLERLLSKFQPSSEVAKLNRGDKVVLSDETVQLWRLAKQMQRDSGGAFNIRNKGYYDLGGIAKGYAVEHGRGLLLKQGVKSAIIDMHSSVAVIGGPWKIAVFDPRTGDARQVITLLNGDALSTSGQYEQPGHIVDPRTGQAAARCLSVTIVTSDAAIADALSTAIFVLGVQPGIRLANKYRAKYLIIERNGQQHDNFGAQLR